MKKIFKWKVKHNKNQKYYLISVKGIYINTEQNKKQDSVGDTIPKNFLERKETKIDGSGLKM